MQENLSRRELNQRETWNAIHEAAFSLARDEGLNAATIEEIAARAGISRRTFFNYFPTKEDAILGTRLPTLPEEIVQDFLSSEEDDLTRVVNLLVAVLRTALTPEAFPTRREIITEHPGLRGRLAYLLGEVEHLVSDLLHGQTEHAEDLSFSIPTDDDRAIEVLLALAGAIAKHSYTRYHEAGTEDFEPYLKESVTMFRKVVDETR